LQKSTEQFLKHAGTDKPITPEEELPEPAGEILGE
jgi:hypothetical protein